MCDSGEWLDDSDIVNEDNGNLDENIEQAPMEEITTRRALIRHMRWKLSD